METQQKPKEQEILAGLSARLLKARRGWLRDAARSASPKVFAKLASMYQVRNAIRAEVLQAMKDQSRLQNGAFAAELCALLRAEYECLAAEGTSRCSSFLLECLWFCINSPAGDWQPLVAFARSVAAASDGPAGLSEEITATCDLYEALLGDDAAAHRALAAWEQGLLPGGERLFDPGTHLDHRQLLAELARVLREQPERAGFDLLAGRYLAACEALSVKPDPDLGKTMARIKKGAVQEASAIIAEIFGPSAPGEDEHSGGS